MTFLPGDQRIIEECLELFGIANTFFISKESQGQFVPLQYINRELEIRAEQLLIEKLLAVAIKVRFLDDQSRILERHDRKINKVGYLFVEDAQESTQGIRTALNKIIHYKEINVVIQPVMTAIVETNPASATRDLLIPGGFYQGHSVVIHISGKQNNKKWRYELDLFFLLNEILRVFYLSNDSKSPEESEQ